ncbi:DUF3310 domain-containing protein [bacterium]|nr:DUF3310 domain-containing protein [bacterium]
MANSPEHYGSSWKVGDFIREQQLSFHLGNAIKYIARCGKKPTADPIDDLTKAIHYLENEREFLRNSSARISESVRAAARVDDFLFEASAEFDR